jgi:hypothetical protein
MVKCPLAKQKAGRQHFVRDIRVGGNVARTQFAHARAFARDEEETSHKGRNPIQIPHTRWSEDSLSLAVQSVVLDKNPRRCSQLEPTAGIEISPIRCELKILSKRLQTPS